MLSVFEFEDFEVGYFNGNKLVNYWGYSTIHVLHRTRDIVSIHMKVTTLMNLDIS